jgi:hypothetical protein
MIVELQLLVYKSHTCVKSATVLLPGLLPTPAYLNQAANAIAGARLSFAIVNFDQ